MKILYFLLLGSFVVCFSYNAVEGKIVSLTSFLSVIIILESMRKDKTQG